jgi:hypothetical protein
MDAGGMDAVLDCMKKFASNQRILEHASSAIVNLTLGQPEIQAAVAKAG